MTIFKKIADRVTTAVRGEVLPAIIARVERDIAKLARYSEKQDDRAAALWQEANETARRLRADADARWQSAFKADKLCRKLQALID